MPTYLSTLMLFAATFKKFADYKAAMGVLLAVLLVVFFLWAIVIGASGASKWNTDNEAAKKSIIAASLMAFSVGIISVIFYAAGLGDAAIDAVFS